MSEKNYLIIGGSQGIGLGIVRRLTEAGGHVTVVSRTAGELTSLPLVEHIQLDVLTDEIPADRLPQSIDGMAYCPGSINLGPLRGIKAEQMRNDYELNVIGAIKCIQSALGGLKAASSSSIVLFSTVAVGQGLAMHASVAAAKGAVEGLSKALAAELAPKIRVNCLAPSLTDTPLAAKFLSTEQKRAAMDARHPLKRVGTVDDVAGIATYLLSEESSWITGQVIGVDGGMSTLRT